MNRVATTAHRVFQERWLRDNGKVRSIAPVPLHPRDLVGGWGGDLSAGLFKLPRGKFRSRFASLLAGVAVRAW